MWPISKQRGLAFHPASSFFTFTLELNLLMLIVAAVLTGLNNPVFAIPFSSQASRFQDLGNSTRNIPLISSRVDHVSLIRHARNLSSMKFFAGTNRLQSGHLDIFANKDDANIPACDVSVVLSYRERIDPVDKILQTRLDQKDVCHFHLVIILWDVPWANHHVSARERESSREREGEDPRFTIYNTHVSHRAQLIDCYIMNSDSNLSQVRSDKRDIFLL
eukprot:m.65678 g.65678  ORF g.65678 m.65678 type:complete len:219 (-) comp13552_c0_seq4:1993-2649(-)